MPSWSEILSELATLRNQAISRYDIVRRKYLSELSRHTQRNTILYATNWTSPTGLPIDPSSLSITFEDIQGLMEVIHGLKGHQLDLILHSPGGFPEAADAFVKYIRTKFQDIRVIIPYAAMSAAAMIACSANRIVMGKHSFIGPIDPQLVLQTQLGIQSIPAQAILQQFEKAKMDCQDQKNLNFWYPIIAQFGPALIVQCQNADKLAKELVSEWLEKYMFAGLENANAQAKHVANYLADHTKFKTHSKHIDRDEARGEGLMIENLEDDQKFQDLVLSVFHATTHTFTGTGTTSKIIENQLGKAFIKTQQLVQYFGQQGVPSTAQKDEGKHE